MKQETTPMMPKSWWYILKKIAPHDPDLTGRHTVDAGAWKILHREPTREKAIAHLDEKPEMSPEIHSGYLPDDEGRKLWGSDRFYSPGNVIRLRRPKR